jgi:ATP-dependent DNA ligase
VSDALDSLRDDERALLRRAPQPRSVEPMKAVLTDERFSDPAWLFERKLDGVRCLAFADGDGVVLKSRTGRTVNGSYPEVVEALERDSAGDFVVDGEIVAFKGDVTSFERLQRRMQLSDPGGGASNEGVDLLLPVRRHPSGRARHHRAAAARKEVRAPPRALLPRPDSLAAAPKQGR